MKLSSASKALLILGAVVGSAAGLALAFGLRADQIPSWMITVGMYKLAFIAAAGLFAAGAILGRAAKSRSGHRETASEADRRGHAIGPGSWRVSDSPEAQPERVDRERRDR